MKLVLVIFALVSCATKPVKIASPEGKIAVQSAFKSKTPQFRRCWNNEIQEYEDVKASSFYFTVLVDDDGSAQEIDVKTKKNKAVPDKLKTCLKDVVYKTTFPNPMSGEEYQVKQPINFFPESPQD